MKDNQVRQQARPKRNNYYANDNKKSYNKNNYQARGRRPMPRRKPSSVKIIPLGGLGQIGMNITAFECNNQILIVDCGLAFPDEDMLGIDLVIPDITYLKDNASKIRGLVITHGHEDHIGAIPYFEKELNVPIYATKLTMALIENKLKEHGILNNVERHVVTHGDKVKLGIFNVEFIKTNHSIADAAALAITTPAGVIVHTGDFKIDHTPLFGEAIDLARFAELGSKGVLALMADSTNVERQGYTPSEKNVGKRLDNLFAEHLKGRMIIATFASNVDRVQHIINSAHKYGRKVAVEGRSMVNIISTASELPGLVNWHPYNKLKRPGIHKLFSYNAIACGSDTVQYFQWRKGRGSFEQYHGAVVDHLGTNDTRIFKEVAALGAELDGLSEITGTLIRSKVALLFDWDNMWAIDDVKALGQESKKYPETSMSVYKELTKRGVDVDVIASDEPLDDYDVVVAPMLYMLRDGAAESLAAFVKRGGQLLSTYFTGYVDKDQLCILGGFPGNGLADVFGIISEEIDTLYPSDRNSVSFTDGSSCELRDYAEILRVGTADVLGTYDSDFYAGNAAVTVNSYGEGKAYYVAARIDYSKLGEIMEQMMVNAGIAIKDLPDGVQYHCRYADDGTAYGFYLNNTNEPQTISEVHGTDIQTKNIFDGKMELAPFGVSIIKENN